jgi:adenine-specific DNA methylase
VAAAKLPNGLSVVPEEPLPLTGSLGFRVQRYGMLQWSDLFTALQKLAMVTLARLVRETNSRTIEDYDERFAQMVQHTLALAL